MLFYIIFTLLARDFTIKMPTIEQMIYCVFAMGGKMRKIPQSRGVDWGIRQVFYFCTFTLRRERSTRKWIKKAPPTTTAAASNVHKNSEIALNPAERT